MHLTLEGDISAARQPSAAVGRLTGLAALAGNTGACCCLIGESLGEISLLDTRLMPSILHKA
jgi:hypothetical protein